MLVILFAGYQWMTSDGDAEQPAPEVAAAPEASAAPDSPDATPEATPEVVGEATPAPTPAETAAPAPATPAAGPAATVDLSSITPYKGAALAPASKPVNAEAETAAAKAAKAFQAGRYPEARAEVEQALAKSPGSARYESLRARVLHAQGDHEGALEQLDAAVQHAPKDAQLYRQRASVQVALGRSANARRDMAAFQRLNDGTSPSSPP